MPVPPTICGAAGESPWRARRVFVPEAFAEENRARAQPPAACRRVEPPQSPLNRSRRCPVAPASAAPTYGALCEADLPAGASTDIGGPREIFQNSARRQAAPVQGGREIRSIGLLDG